MSMNASLAHNRDRVNIVEPGRLHPAVSFARATTATYMGADGLLHTAAVNEPRYEYDAAGNYLGLLIEEARTNTIKWSDDLTNPAWTKSGPTIYANTVVAPDGTLTGDTINFTGTSNYVFQPVTYAVAAGDKCTISQCYKTPTKILRFGGATPSGTDVFSVVDVGSGWYRQIVTRTFTVSAATPSIQLLSSALDVGISLQYAWGAQLERGAVASSYTPTTTGAVTRSADVAGITDPTKIGFNSAAGTTTAIVDYLGGADGNIRGLFAANATARMMYSDSNAMNIYNGSVATGAVMPAAGTTFKVASSYGSHIALILNGGAICTSASTGGMIGTSLGVGSLNTGGNVWVGHIKRLTYYPRQLPDIELQRLSA